MITRVDPPDPNSTSALQVDSDAGNYWLAVKDVERWAAEHGFVPVGGVRPVLVDGRRQFRAVCYRPTPEDAAAAEEDNRVRRERAAGMMVTPHSYSRQD